jgi:REP element-mobilizing transposase RayT
MKEDLFKNKYRISSIRLKESDYSQNGYYFVTICIKDRECLFGRECNDKIILSDIGKIADKCWQEIPLHFPFVQPDKYVIMPNHVHGIIVINKPNVVETQHIASETENGPQHIETQYFASL